MFAAVLHSVIGYFIRQNTKRSLDEMIFVYCTFHDMKRNLQNLSSIVSVRMQLIVCAACEQEAFAGKDNLYPYIPKIVKKKVLKYRDTFFWQGALCLSTDERLEMLLAYVIYVSNNIVENYLWWFMMGWYRSQNESLSIPADGKF